MHSNEDALARQAAQVSDSVLRRERRADDRRKRREGKRREGKRREGKMLFFPMSWMHCGKIWPVMEKRLFSPAVWRRRILPSPHQNQCHHPRRSPETQDPRNINVSRYLSLKPQCQTQGSVKLRLLALNLHEFPGSFPRCQA
jgi:hypothetical protein